MVLAHDLTFDTGTLHVAPVGFESEVAHGGQDAALYRFHSVGERRDGSADKHSHAVGQVVVLDLAG